MAEEERPKVYDINNFQMFTPAPGVEGKFSRLVWGMLKGKNINNPRLTVFTGVPSDGSKSYGMITAAMNMETLFILFKLLEKVILGDNNTKELVECYTKPWNKDGPRGDKVLNSTIMVGKDKEGLVWISVVAESRPKIKFTFSVSDWHRILKSDGTSYSPSECSVLQALGTLEALKRIYENLSSGYREPSAFTKNDNPTKSSAPNTNLVIEEELPF